MSSPRTPQSGLLLHCIGHARALPLADEGDLRRVRWGELAAMAAPITDRRSMVAPEAPELLRYGRRIQRIHASADVLPMRFGSVLADEDAVRAHLRERREEYFAALDRIAGCVEMSVRALVRADGPPPGGPDAKAMPIRSGTDYLKARQRRHAWEEELQERCAALERAVVAAALPHCREHRAEGPQTRPDGARVSIHFLVPKGRVPALREAMEPLLSLDACHSLTGPWPCYNFVPST
jgi:hypothetical protein